MPEVLQYVRQGGQLSQVFHDLLDFVFTVYKVTTPALPRPTFIGLDEDGMPVNEPT